MTRFQIIGVVMGMDAHCGTDYRDTLRRFVDMLEARYRENLTPEVVDESLQRLIEASIKLRIELAVENGRGQV